MILATLILWGHGIVWADNGEGAATERLLAEVARSPDAAAAVRAVAASRDALARARKANGTERATSLFSLARAWAETARALLAARQAEAELITAQADANELADRLGHARILLEETLARRERVAHEQQRLENEIAPRASEKKTPVATGKKP